MHQASKGDIRVCPTFYTWHFNRSARLMLSTVIRTPSAVTLPLPHKVAGRSSTFYRRMSVYLAGMGGRLS